MDRAVVTARSVVLGGSLVLAGACSGIIDGDATNSAAAPTGNHEGAAASRPGSPSQPPTPPSEPAGCGVDSARLWELTPDQYTRTAQALIGTKSRPGDDLDQGQSREAGAALSDAHVAALYESARRLGDEAAAVPAKLHPCLADRAGDPACIRSFVQEFGARAFRRDLDSQEVDSYVALYRAQAAAQDAPTALRLVLRVMFGSPHFVFRSELGPLAAKVGELVRLTPFERASAISYYLTDGPPDAELLQAARAGQLESRAQVLAHARRLLASGATAAGLRRFFRDRFRLDEVDSVQKDPKLFPAWVPGVPDDLAREAETFVEHVLWQDGGRLETLYGTAYGFANTRIAALQGVSAPPGATRDAFVKTMLPGARGGLLTLGAVMARLARIDDTAPVARGLFVRDVILCQHPPAPPPEVNAVPPPPDGKRTQRDRLAQHSTDPTCAACHATIDPIGLAFETFDAVGRWRTTDVGRPIDPAGVLTGVGGAPIRFQDAAALGRVLAASQEGRACMAARLYAHAQGLGDIPANRRCAVDRLARALEASRGDLLGLAAEVAADEGFFVRRVPGL